ncbi:hypothetical protein [Nonomuraea angiospora]
MPAADETVTAARRELALVCAPPVGTAPALYVDARPARTRPRVGRTAAMPPGQALHRPDPQRRSAPPTPGVAETSTATPGLVSLVPPTAAGAAETPTAAPAPVPLIPANRRPCGRNTARDSRPLSHSSPPTGHRRRRDAGPGPARPRQPAARAAGTPIVVPDLVRLVRAGRLPMRKLVSHPFDDVDRAAQGKAIDPVITF